MEPMKPGGTRQETSAMLTGRFLLKNLPHTGTDMDAAQTEKSAVPRRNLEQRFD